MWGHTSIRNLALFLLPKIEKDMRIVNSDCFGFMQNELEGDSIDTIITDPPYGLSFMGKRWDYDVPNSTIWRGCLNVLKPGGTMLVFAGSRTQHRMAVAIEDAGFILKDCIMWIYGSGFPKATDISKQLDKDVEREVVLSYKRSQQPSNSMGGGVTGQRTVIRNITKPATPEALLWNGWKSHGLKPAYEPILVCMKPNDGSYAENALKHGVSGLNIDGGRIPLQEQGEDRRLGGNGNWATDKTVKNVYEGGYEGERIGSSIQGRFPANVIFEDGVTNAEWSRFFYCAKASKTERNMGCEELDIKQTTGGGGMNNTKDDVCGKYGSIKASGHNHHPTVKPLKLMEYLCTLTKTPTGGIVFDPFMGSGTTGIACKNTGREFIGCETDKDYFEIAGKRITGKTAGATQRRVFENVMI